MYFFFKHYCICSCFAFVWWGSAIHGAVIYKICDLQHIIQYLWTSYVKAYPDLILICQSCGVQQSRKRRCLEKGVIFDDEEEEEEERANRRAQATAEGSLPPAESCVSIWKLFNL